MEDTRFATDPGNIFYACDRKFYPTQRALISWLSCPDAEILDTVDCAISPPISTQRVPSSKLPLKLVSGPREVRGVHVSRGPLLAGATLASKGIPFAIITFKMADTLPRIDHLIIGAKDIHVAAKHFLDVYGLGGAHAQRRTNKLTVSATHCCTDGPPLCSILEGQRLMLPRHTPDHACVHNMRSK